MNMPIARFAVKLYIFRSIISKPVIIFLLYLLLLGAAGTDQNLKAARKILVLAIAAEQIYISSLNILNKQTGIDASDQIEPRLDRHSAYSLKKVARANLIREMAPLIHQLVQAETAADEAFIKQLKAQLRPMQEYLLEISLVKPFTLIE
jgi:hypothetical protein